MVESTDYAVIRLPKIIRDVVLDVDCFNAPEIDIVNAVVPDSVWKHLVRELSV